MTDRRTSDQWAVDRRQPAARVGDEGSPGYKKALLGRARRSRTVAAIYADAVVGCVLLICLACLAAEFAVPRIALPVPIIAAAFTIVLAGLFSVRPLDTVLRLRYWLNSLAFPSVSLVTAAAMLLVAVTARLCGVDTSLILIGVAALIAAPVLRDVSSAARSWMQPRNAASASSQESLPQELGWVWREAPLSDIAEDRFGHSALVRRLAAMIRNGTCRSFGLTGPHGSGKTTVVRMAETELKQTGEDVWFVYVNGWGKCVDELPAFVLTDTVATLHEKGVETMALATWPADYMRQIVGDSTWFSRLFGLCMQSQHGSSAILQRIDPILDAIGKRLVIVIEDVDRTEPTNGLSALCRLLDEFGVVRNVSFFFLKSDETETCVDFHRLCEHTEMMPRLRESDVRSSLSICVDAFVCKAGGDTLPNPERLDFGRLGASRVLGGHTTTNDALWPALAALAHTPRSLKRALRRAANTWNSLHGEVDLLDLLTWSLLREGCPSGYTFVKQHLAELRSQLPTSSKNHEQTVRPLRTQIDQLGLSNHQARALKIAITLLGFNISLHNEEYIHIHMAAGPSPFTGNISLPPQSVLLTTPTDYFMRLEAGELDERVVPDQAIITAILSYVKTRSPALPGRLVESEVWSAKVEQFGGLIPTDRLLDLIEDHISTAVAVLGAKAGDDTPGLSQLRAVLRDRHNSCDLVIDHVKRLLATSLDGSLELAHAVYSGYANPADPDVKRAARDHWVQEIRLRVEKNPEYLSRVLNPALPYALYHTLRYRGDYPSFNSAVDWQWLAPCLIDALRFFPEAVTPDVVNLFIGDTSPSRLGTGPQYELHEQYFLEMCPSPDVRGAMVKHFLDFAAAHPNGDSTAARIMYMAPQLQRCVTVSAIVASDESRYAQARVPLTACDQSPIGEDT